MRSPPHPLHTAPSQADHYHLPAAAVSAPVLENLPALTRNALSFKLHPVRPGASCARAANCSAAGPAVSLRRTHPAFSQSTNVSPVRFAPLPSSTLAPLSQLQPGALLLPRQVLTAGAVFILRWPLTRTRGAEGSTGDISAMNTGEYSSRQRTSCHLRNLLPSGIAAP